MSCRQSCLGVIFEKKISWGPHIEMLEAKTFRTFMRIYSLFKSGRMRSNIKLIHHKALARSVCLPSWELAADTCLLKLQSLQNKVLCTTESFPRCKRVRGLHTAFTLPYVYEYVRTLCRKLDEVIQNHENKHICNTGKREDRHRICNRLERDGWEAYERSRHYSPVVA
jgi:hypothetical protein